MAEKIEIRNAYFERGKTVSEISRETGHDRKTVRAIINRDNWNSRPPVPQGNVLCPKLDPFKPVIDEWLLNDKSMRKAQRHTARRVFDRLKSEAATRETFKCSYELVNQYVREKKKEIFGERREGYIPLEHKPGEAQADFGAAEYIETGKRKYGRYLNLSYPNSNHGYFQLFPGENEECLLEGLRNIFLHSGGVPREIWFDNAATMVTKVLKGGKRIFTEKFERFSVHHGFKAVFCNPDSGNEKGSVENKVGYHRRNMLVPIPRFESLDEFNRTLLAKCDSDANRPHYRFERTVRELFESDKAAFLPLPKTEFDTSAYMRVKTDKYAIFTLDGCHDYSTAPKYAESQVQIRLTSQTVTVLDEKLSEIVTHPRLYGKEQQRSMEWIPYLDQLAMRPRAVKYCGVYEMLPDCVRLYIDECEGSETGSIIRMLAKLTKASGWGCAVQTVAQAIKNQARDPDSLLALHRRIHMDVPALPPIEIDTKLPELEIFIPNLSAYDEFIKLGGELYANA